MARKEGNRKMNYTMAELTYKMMDKLLVKLCEKNLFTDSEVVEILTKSIAELNERKELEK